MLEEKDVTGTVGAIVGATVVGSVMLEEKDAIGTVCTVVGGNVVGSTVVEAIVVVIIKDETDIVEIVVGAIVVGTVMLEEEDVAGTADAVVGLSLIHI